MSKLTNKLEAAHELYMDVYNKVDEHIKERCEFEAGLTFLPGDGHMVIHTEDANVAPLWVMVGKSKRKKLTLEEFNKYTK